MIVLKFLSKLFKALRSGDSPGQLAGGFALGMIIGLTPLWSLHNLLVVILIIIIKVNISMAPVIFETLDALRESCYYSVEVFFCHTVFFVAFICFVRFVF